MTAAKKSTIGRAEIARGLVRAGFAALNHLPGLAALWAEELFFTPRRTPPSPRVRGFLSTGRRRDVEVDRTRIATWEWGEGPVVVLVHGWEGVGGFGNGPSGGSACAGRTSTWWPSRAVARSRCW